MKLIQRLKTLNWRIVGAALISVGILHICATLAAPSLSTNSAYQRLAPDLPVNAMRVFPSLTAETQPLPFLTPEFRYAMCRVDSSEGPVLVKVVLPDRGWSVSLYSPDGDSIYAASGQLARPTEIVLEVVSSDERFTGLSPEARGKVRSDDAALAVPAREGIVVVRAPDRGAAYAAKLEKEISSATCRPVFAKD